MEDPLLTAAYVDKMQVLFEYREFTRKQNAAKFYQEEQISKSHVDLIQNQIKKELQELQRNSVEQALKNKEFLQHFKDTNGKLKTMSQPAEQKCEVLHNRKTELLDQLIFYMPHVGLKHKQLLNTENLHTKIRRHEHKRQVGNQEEQHYKSAAENFRQNLINPMEGGKSQMPDDQESLALSYSVNPSQLNNKRKQVNDIKQSQTDKKPDFLQIPEQPQKPQQKKQSGFDYGAYNDDDEDDF